MFLLTLHLAQGWEGYRGSTFPSWCLVGGDSTAFSGRLGEAVGARGRPIDASVVWRAWLYLRTKARPGLCLHTGCQRWLRALASASASASGCAGRAFGQKDEYKWVYNVNANRTGLLSAMLIIILNVMVYNVTILRFLSPYIAPGVMLRAEMLPYKNCNQATSFQMNGIISVEIAVCTLCRITKCRST